jgi:hypothetical protein
MLLAFPQLRDGELELMLDLVHRLVEQVRDSRMHAQHGLRHLQLVLTRRAVIVHERGRQHLLSGMSGGHGQGHLAAAALGFLRLGGVLVQVISQRPRLLGQRGELGPVEAQQRAGGFRGDGLVPHRLRVGEAG